MNVEAIAWRARRTTTVVAVLTLFLLACLMVGRADANPRRSATGHEHAAAVKAGSAALPTVVLVHGAFADASGFAVEIRALQALGYPVIAPADPLRGLTSDSDQIRALLQTISGPIVLVGHSYGGAVITNAARGVPNVVALVYVGAFVPDEGQSISTAYDPAQFPGSLLGPQTTLIRPITNPAAPGGQDADVYISPDSFRTVFAGDQTSATAAVMAASQRPLSYFASVEPSGAPAWRTIPSWDLVTLDDKAIAPAGQLFMARRAGAHISTVHSAHDVMVSHPAAVVSTILAAVHAVG